MPPMEFEPTFSAGERPQNYALDRAATGTGKSVKIRNKFKPLSIKVSFLGPQNKKKKNQVDIIRQQNVRVLANVKTSKLTL